MYEKKIIGKIGEELSCKYLERNYYRIIEKNFICNQGEIDIIAYDIKSREIVFIEVKTRRNFNYGFPCEAVNKQKINHIINCAKYYLFHNRLDNAFTRIDVIEIVFYKGRFKLNHLKNVVG